MAVNCEVRTRPELNLLYNDLTPLMGKINNPAMEIRHLATNFLLKASYLGQDWTHAKFLITMRNPQALKEKTYSADMLDGLAGLYLMTKMMQKVDPQNEAFKVMDEPDASLMVGAAADFILTAGVFFGPATANSMNMAEESTMAEIVKRSQQGQNHMLLIEAGMGALAWALQNPLAPQIPDFSGVSKVIQNLKPIQQQLMIQRLIIKAFNKSDEIPSSFSREDYTRLAQNAGVHSKLGKFYFGLVKNANKLL
ncbi:hypothetical protein M1328_01710 [Patescibacteria group bacterium]|nr:hypothetical protein [Patescibacteria group bacterium]